MAQNLFKTIRKSYFADLLFSAFLSNLIIFAQPIQMLISQKQIVTEHQYASYPAIEENRTEVRVPTSEEETIISSSEPIAKLLFPSVEASGKIGKESDIDSENPSDNFFKVLLPYEDLNKYDALLSYDLYGLENAAETTKSINFGSSYGGKVVHRTKKWTSAREYIPISQLKPGTNEIFFNRRTEENYSYEIKNLKIELIEKKGNLVNANAIASEDGSLYIVGTAPEEITSISISGKPIKIYEGTFEHESSEIQKGKDMIELSYATKLENKTIQVPIQRNRNAMTSFNNSPLANAVKTAGLDEMKSGLISYGEASVEIASTQILGIHSKILMQGLDFKDVRLLNSEAENVTAGKFPGYRISKAFIPDSIPAKLHLKYDDAKIPDGYTSQDIKTFYFDSNARSWKELAVDSVDTYKKEIISTLTNEETDYINGIIKVPESPETGSFAPTAMTDIKYADPSAGVVSISPPSPNNSGTVNTSFPLKLPQGRNGMSPSLAVNYNSEAGNGWMGVGWNLSTPSIALNTTWGAPLYDSSYETELYSMNGSDLVLMHGEYTNPHRTGNINRQPERIFYERKEGSYNMIVRHGSSPLNYWWEVTDKQGNKTFYGGLPGNGVVNNAVMKSANGHIGHWGITRSQDPFGNYVEYTYNLIQDTNLTNSSIPAKKFYLESIKYAKNTNTFVPNYYQVDFKRNSYTVGGTNSVTRQDVTLNARNGYIQVTDALLTEVQVSLINGNNPPTIRTYRFDYKDMPFQKKQLEKISEYDKDGAFFYSNSMEYYNDIGSQSIISGPQESWDSDSNDVIESPLTSLAGSHTSIVPNGSPLGTSVSSGASFGVRVGFGLGRKVKSINNTIGASFNYSTSDQETKISFADINGDGLPDKIFQSGSTMYYRHNSGSGFGAKRELNDLTRLSRTKSKTTGFGFDFNLLGQVGAGKSFSTSKSETDSYFVDYNGDGLIDLISNGLVRFNTTSNLNSLDPSFGVLVSETKNTIQSSGISQSIVNDLRFQTMDELREENPQFDHVKIWTAPYTGIINVTSTARIVAKNNDGINENKFKLTIERATLNQPLGILPQNNILALQNVSATGTPFNINTLVVNKGDILFFRTHNLNHGYGGEIEWNPKITYTPTSQRPSGQKDDNGKIMNIFDEKEDFIINNGGYLGVNSADASATINFNLSAVNYPPNKFSDNIKFVIKRITTNLALESQPESITEWSVSYNVLTGLSGSQTYPGISVGQNTNSKVEFEFYTESTSNVDWSKIVWKPTFKGNTTPLVYAPISHRTYDENVNQTANFIAATSLPIPTINNDGSQNLIVISHNFFTVNQTANLNQIGQESFPLKINWVIKENDGSAVKPIHSRTFYIQKNPNTGAYTFLKTLSPAVAVNLTSDVDFFKFFRTKNQIKTLKDASGNAGGYYSTINIDNSLLGNNNITAIKVELIDGQNSSYPSFVPTILNAPFLAYNPKFYGYSYRNWGQMLYNGGLKFDRNNEGEIINATTPQIFGNFGIDTSLFDFNSQSQTISDPNYDPENDNSNYTNLRYTLYEQDNVNNKYVNPVIIESRYSFNGANLTAFVGRFAESNTHLIYINPYTITQPGSGLFVALKQRSESKGKATSGNLGSVQGTDSEATSEVLNQYIDLNGDRYPDIVTSGNIQYTNMRGALASVLPNSFVSGDQSNDRTLGVTIPIPPKSTVPTPAKANKTNTNIGSGINASSGQSSISRQWIDINGDGLPDKIAINENDVKVNLNMGYGFTEEITWGSGYSNLLSSSRNNVSLGISLQFTPSLGAGFGAAASTADINTTLLDVNGDQLPDLIVRTSSHYLYYLNNGRGFDTAQKIFYNNNNIMERDVTVSGNLYGTFTYGVKFTIFGITFKVVGTPTIGKSADYNEKTATVQDIDGDGLPDVIKKANLLNNSRVDAVLNQVKKTHLLKKVNTPLGGSWTVEYTRDGNTYDMPHSKWAMTNVSTHDGFTGDSTLKPNTTSTAVAYQNPKYDRRERAFFGYEKVIIKEMGTGSTPYRTLVKSFHTENYYLNGAEKSTALHVGDLGQLLSEEKTTYNILNSGGSTVLTQNAANNFGQSATALDKSRLFVTVARTESTSYENGQSLTAIKDFKEYDYNGNLKRVVDYGEGPDDAYRTEIDYHSFVSGIENGTGFPSKIRVLKNSTGELMRQRESKYENGKLTQVKTKLNPQETSITDLNYDNYGNLIQMRNPDNVNDNGDEFYANLEYDTVLQSFPVKITNAFGEFSQTWYNYQFGIPTFTTDVNGQSMRTRIDAKGRTTEITGPNELALENGNGNPNSNGTAWTIRMEYKPSFISITPGAANPTNSEHYAITRHFDPEYASGLNTTNQLLTVSIVDGFGQPLQVKKKHISENGNRWLLSPLEKKDAFGRTLEAYQAGFQQTASFGLDTNDLEFESNNTLTTDPVTMTYDEKDRVKTVKQPYIVGLPWNSANIIYTIEEGMLVQKSTNELNQTENSFIDIRGRNRKTVQNGTVTTAFRYNSINELKKVINNEGQETNYIYDLAGRKTEVQHPDRGAVTFKYDKASRMTEQSSSNLLVNGQKIKYKYDFSRLIGIEYPDVPQNNVTYKYGAITDNFAITEKAIGRLVEQKDATGVQVFGYGRMGEVTKNLRSVAVAGYQSYWFYTKWKYDSWNRVKEITYPDQEIVKYHYNLAGSLNRISSQLNGISPVQDIISEIKYNDYGERAMISHGNGTKTLYTYDVRRRLNTLKHEFNSFNIQKRYGYDQLSNITGISTDDAPASLPATGKIGGPVSHEYFYDNFNRIITATGTYTGANDNTNPYLAQRYSLAMEYNTNHTIKTKTQSQWQGTVASFGTSPANEIPVYKNSYKLDYSGYGASTHVAGTNYSYNQPHAVTSIVESPTWTTVSGEDPRIRTKEISYDANGNQTQIKEVVGEVKTSLRQNLWDAENRIRAVNLKPDDATSHPIAIYTYNAGGERTVRYNYDHIGTFSNEQKVGQVSKDNVMLYPSGLLMGKAYHDKGKERIDRIRYTKHYYVGSERISAKTGTIIDLGMFPADLLGSELPQLNVQEIRNKSKTIAFQTAADEILKVHSLFNVPPPALEPIDELTKINFRHDQKMLDYFYFHPDHLGSSSYITNLAGTVSQHMEYLPFGETLVDEHLNSRNSPFKYNGKEFDEETGNYYYGARYYDPKWSIFVSVDPLAEKYPNVSPYAYCLNNPVNMIDPDGRDAILIVFPNYKVDTGIRVTVRNPFTGKPITLKAPKPELGHAGVLIIDNKTGLTSYYEYGRYDKEQKGIVRKVSVSNVVIGKDGKPTQESLDKVLGQISSKSGHGGKIEGAYIESDKTNEMKTYAEKLMKQNSDPNRDPYTLRGNNCGTFASDVVNQDPEVSQPSIINPTPGNVVDEYQEEGNARVTFDPKTKKSNIEKQD